MKIFIAVCLITAPLILLFIGKGGDFNVDSRDWEQAADDRIERYRKGDLVIDLRNTKVDVDSIVVEQLSHEFTFGTAVQASMILDTSPNGEKYRGLVKKYFNEVVFENDLKWHNWKDDKNGKFDKTQTLKAIQWLVENGIRVRGHYLAWCPLQTYEKFYEIIPEEVYNDPENYKNALLSHIDDILSATESNISEWDILNHPVTRSQKFQVSNENGKMLITDYLGSNIFEEIIDKVRSKNRFLKLFVNEDNILTSKADKKDVYFEFVRKLILKNHNPDGIGFMGHFRSNDLPKIEHVEKTLNQFSSFKIPLKITEFDVLFGEMNEEFELSNDEKILQANFTHDFMKICFANPSIEGFVLWGFWENAHWFPAASLWDKNWNLKPNGRAFTDLVKRKWFTNLKFKINNSNQLKIRIFFGKHRIRIYDRKGNLAFDREVNILKKNKKQKLIFTSK